MHYFPGDSSFCYHRLELLPPRRAKSKTKKEEINTGHSYPTQRQQLFLHNLDIWAEFRSLGDLFYYFIVVIIGVAGSLFGLFICISSVPTKYCTRHRHTIASSSESMGDNTEYIFLTKSPFVYRTVMEKYCIDAPAEGERFNWLKLIGKPIAPDDCSQLMNSLSFWYCGHRVERTKAWRPERMHFRCEICPRFHILCAREPGAPDGSPLFLSTAESCFEHAVEEHRDRSIRKNRRKDPVVVRDCRQFLDYMSETFNRSSTACVRAGGLRVLRDAGVTVEGLTRSPFSRLKLWTQVLHRTEEANMYIFLGDYLTGIHILNKNMTVALQKDENDCFCRMFVSIPDAANVFGDLCLPALHMDGTFSKTNLYDGVLFLVIGTSGNGGLILLAAAWIPVEDNQNMIFVIEMMEKAGFDMSSIPIFTDRGKLLSAATALHRDGGTLLSLKYCLEHIYRNIKANFTIARGQIQLLRTALSKTQNSKDIFHFMSSCENIISALGTEVGQNVVLYILKGIHPRHWTVFGNLISLDDSEWEPHYYAYVGRLVGSNGGWEAVRENHMNDIVPLGQKFPLFGHSRNNCAESAAGLLVHHGIRTTIPPKSMKKFLDLCRKHNGDYFKEVSENEASGVKLSNIALKLHQDVNKKLPSLEVTECSVEDDGSHQVFVRDDRRSFTVVISTSMTMSCCCALHEMYCYPCHHCIKAVRWLASSERFPLFTNETKQELVTNSVPSWANAQDAAAFVQDMEVFKPLEWKDISMVRTHRMVDPPPSYRQGRQNVNRIMSNGKDGYAASGQRVAGYDGRLTYSSELTSRTTFCNADRQIIADLTARGVFDIFEPLGDDNRNNNNNTANGNIGNNNSEEMPIFDINNTNINDVLEIRLHRVRNDTVRQQYRCSECGDTSHTIRVCPTFLKDGRGFLPSSEVVPDELIVFLPPSNLTNNDNIQPNPLQSLLYINNVADPDLGNNTFASRSYMETSPSIDDNNEVVRPLNDTPIEVDESWFPLNEGDAPLLVGRPIREILPADQFVDLELRDRNNNNQDDTTETISSSSANYTSPTDDNVDGADDGDDEIMAEIVPDGHADEDDDVIGVEVEVEIINDDSNDGNNEDRNISMTSDMTDAWPLNDDDSRRPGDDNNGTGSKGADVKMSVDDRPSKMKNDETSSANDVTELDV